MLGDSQNGKAWDWLGATEPRPIRVVFRGPTPPTGEKTLSSSQHLSVSTLTLDIQRGAPAGSV